MAISRKAARAPRKTIRHYDEPGQAHHLTFSCYRRLSLLSKDRTRRWLIDAIRDAKVKHGFDLWAWVIMPEHVHLLVSPRRTIYSTALILADIKRPVGIKAIGYLRRTQPNFLDRLKVVNKNRSYHRFWQPGAGFDHNLVDPKAVGAVINYIHYNPVRRGLTNDIYSWIWSSANAWLQRDCLLNVDRTVPGDVEFPRDG